jgi:hypothetical protein
MLYEKNEDVLRGLYKAAVFVVQAIVFQETGKHVKRQTDLLTVAKAEERSIVNTFLTLRNGGAVDFYSMAEALFLWSKKWVNQ